jgi:hypothetical protein
MIEYPRLLRAAIYDGAAAAVKAVRRMEKKMSWKSGDLAVGVIYQQSGIDSNDKNCRMGRL